MALGPNNEEPIGGDHARGLNQVAKTGIKADLVEGNKVIKWVKDLTQHMKVLRKEAEMTQRAVGGVGQGGGSGRNANGHAQFVNTSQTAPTSNMVTDLAGSNGPKQRGGKGESVADMLGGGANVKMFAAYAAGQVGQAAMGALDARIDRGVDYAVASDRRGSQYSQMYGMSQMGYMTQVRRPLQNMRLGAGGINQLADMELRTGFNATSPGYASSVAGLRALSGYTKTTADVLQTQNTMLNPEVANRMFALSGISPIQMGGGGMTDPIKLRQQIVRTMGLTSASQMKGALAPGSITRARMRDLGLSEEMQTETLQYAQANLTFKEKGGRGMYDPSSEAHRKRMGVEGRLSTEVEETEAKRTAREEDFQRRQIDNFETMERNTQRMVELMGSIEDKVSGLVGARASGRSWMKIGGKLAMVAGAGLMATTGWTGIGLGVGAGVMAGGMAMSGDPNDAASGTSGGSGQAISSANDHKLTAPWGYSGNGPGGQKSLEEIKGNAAFKKLSGTMQTRLLNLMRAGQGRIGIGQGYRDPEQQKRMFLERHVETTKGNHDRVWNGKYWKLVRGAPAAPPGSSMHEIGMAADLVGDMDWLQKNAGKFGLKTFAGVNNEPWHVQPAELPNSRREYEGGNFELNDNTMPGGTPAPTTGGDDPSGHGGGGPSGYSGALGHGNYDLNAALSDIIGQDSTGRGWTGWSGGGRSSANSETMAAGTPGPTVALEGESGVRVAAQAAYNAGFRGEDLFKIVAIAGRESGWKNTMRSDTSDTGIWQINWKANEKHARTAGAKKREDLLDPNLNARAAYELYKASGFHGWKASGNSQYLIDRGMGPAGWDPKGNEMWHTDSHQDAAREAISSLNLSGDPYSMGDRSPANRVTGGGGKVMISQPIQISVAPQINFHGSPGTPDLQKIANEVTRLIKAEVETLEMRNA